jgi:hypothetical protein
MRPTPMIALAPHVGALFRRPLIAGLLPANSIISTLPVLAHVGFAGTYI